MLEQQLNTYLDMLNVGDEMIPLDGIAVSLFAWITAPPGSAVRNTFIIGIIHWVLHSFMIRRMNR